MKPTIPTQIHTTRYCLERFMTDQEKEDFDRFGKVPEMHKDPIAISATDLSHLKESVCSILQYIGVGVNYVTCIDQVKFRSFDVGSFAWECAKRCGGIEFIVKTDGMIVFTRVEESKAPPARVVKQINVYRNK